MKDRLTRLAMLHRLAAGSVLSEARTVAAAEAVAIERISLEEYREESVARYRGAIKRLWVVLRAVWNTRAAPLGLRTFDADLELCWHPGDLSFRSANVPAVAPELLTPNEWRRRLGEGPLRKPDGSLDPDGDVPMWMLRTGATQTAAAASVGARLGAFDFGPNPPRDPPATAGEGGAARPTQTRGGDRKCSGADREGGRRRAQWRLGAGGDGDRPGCGRWPATARFRRWNAGEVLPARAGRRRAGDGDRRQELHADTAPGRGVADGPVHRDGARTRSRSWLVSADSGRRDAPARLGDPLR